MLVQRRRSNAEEMKGPSYGISSLLGDGGRGETSHVAPAPGRGDCAALCSSMQYTASNAAIEWQKNIWKMQNPAESNHQHPP